MSTNVETFFADLDGGVFEEKLSRVLSDVAGAVIDHGSTGQVIIQLDLKQIGGSSQVTVNHCLKYKRPTSKGSVSEVNTTTTPMYVGGRGALTFFPEDQGQLLGKDGSLAEENVSKFPTNTRKQ